jgi:hypothetical protein
VREQSRYNDAMLSLATIHQQIAALPHRYVFYTKKEIRYLPEILSEDEQILALTSGFANGKTWLCVCTNHRILFINRGMFFGLHQVQMNLDRVQSIDSSHTIFFGSIRIWDGVTSMAVSLILKSSIAPFVRATQQAIDRYKRSMVHDLMNTVQSAHNTAKSAGSLHQPTPWLDELSRLSAMKKEGMLSEEEFLTAKRKLLAEQPS